MIKSMTGFGHALYDDGQVQISAEIKSLNSKFLDLNLRLPRAFSDKEMEIRNLLNDELERGKISISIEYQRTVNGSAMCSYNESLFLYHYQELRRLADKVLSPHDNLFQLAINAPEVVQHKLEDKGNEEHWAIAKNSLMEAIRQCQGFRSNEGKSLEGMLKGCCEKIRENAEAIEQLDPKRVEKIRERIKGNIKALLGEGSYDENRLEQEIVFFIEKLDINEEKVRLKTHLQYFLQVIDEKQSGGKKLGFIAQEIGREINTIGSKANDADIQKHVVLMKEELEKIKEQLNNVL